MRPTAVFGSVHRPDGELQPTAGSLDLDVIEILTEEYWSTDLEVFVAHDPDLIISTAWSGDDPNSVWGFDEEIVERAEQIAPIVAINYSAGLMHAIT